MALKPDTPERQALVLFTRFFDGEFTENRQLCLRNQVLELHVQGSNCP